MQKIANTNDNYYQFVPCLILSAHLDERDGWRESNFAFNG
ncbi:hypothetical protein PROVRUST_07809 [Providencia rustigianii DSM 4541]|uniref:Uncharacterized protein n=1 Tax=Providencia rustigianii DSM 4541 TaxID=500637 RepID=D1P6K7_9GAMM|nr:hypothetical protein PROVRUST_07809 [Providencia rustigianii DSM 4541]